MTLHKALFFMVAFQFFGVFGTEIIMWNACAPLSKRSINSTSSLVTVRHGEFQLNGRPYRFHGTNAYWLQMLSDEDLNNVMYDIVNRGFTVVRTWAFNDVSKKPLSGTYFQILQDGTAKINEGPDGLQRLDEVVAAANKYGLKILFTLTNNWNPEREEQSTSSKPFHHPNVLPRAYLSNDYGGMDLYIRNFAGNATHDDFYTNPVIIRAFKNYISHVITRFIDNSTVLGWELANDPRCSSTLPGSNACNTTTITRWVDDISSYVKSLDCGHLVTAGDGGFYCLTCEKLFAPPSSKEEYSFRVTSGPTFDGSFGVDTEDITSVPCIDFGSFQFFPDQVQYYPGNLTNFAINATVQGDHWVKQHADTAVALGKPEVISAIGIVTQDAFKDFVPFNSSTRMPPGLPCGGVENGQKDNAFLSWSAVGLSTGGKIGGILEYQFFTSKLLNVPQWPESPKDGYKPETACTFCCPPCCWWCP